MCNHEVLDAIRRQLEQFISHTDNLRNRYNDVQAEFQGGNLDKSSLATLNEALHLIERDAAEFEKLLEGDQ